MARRSSRLALGLLLLAGLLLLTFALPVRVWRTGELPAPPLDLVRGGPPVDLSRRIWVDTDAACGRGRTTDPDDCFALLLLALSDSATVVGISTVGGNAPLAVTDSVVRALTAVLPWEPPPVHRGERATEALGDALAEGPLTVLALGPLTNLAAALRAAPAHRHNVARLVAVMGRRPGHLFHPAEGAGGGMLLGHGPVFTDFNFAQDREAAAEVLSLGLPVTLVPYEAARQITLGPQELDRISGAGPAGAWVVERSRRWLEYWQEDVGREGFYPFDLVAAAYALAPGMFDCARAEAWVGEDERLWGWLPMPDALLVGRGPGAEVRPRARGRAIYCPELAPALEKWLIGALTSVAGTTGGRGAAAPPS